MIIKKELQLTSFEFWSGAENHSFTYQELNELENVIDGLYCDGVEETTINDLFLFEDEFLCDTIGVDYEEDYLNRE